MQRPKAHSSRPGGRRCPGLIVKRGLSCTGSGSCPCSPSPRAAFCTGGGVAAATSAPAARGATPAPASGGHVFVTAYQNDDLPGATVVLSGAIGDFGAAVSVLANGTVDPEHSSQLNLALTQGSFRIVIGPLHAKLENALSHAPYNLRTCSGHVAVTWAAPVVPGSGTGAYKGISGTFKLTITGNEVDAKPGCLPFSGTALLAQSIFVAGSGPFRSVNRTRSECAGHAHIRQSCASCVVMSLESATTHIGG